MQAWAKDQKIGLSMLTLMGDPNGELTKDLDMELTHPGPISKGIIGRCKRHALHVVDGEVKLVHISEGPGMYGGTLSMQIRILQGSCFCSLCIR